MSVFAGINQKVTLTAAFGSGYGSLVGTVGYTIYKGDGTTFQARATAGIAEAPAGTGNYRVELASTVFTSQFDGYVVWDTGGTSPVYTEPENVFISDRLDTAVSGVAGSVWSQTTRTLTSNPRAEN